MKTSVAGVSVASRAKTSKASRFSHLPQIYSPACLEAEILHLLFIFVLVTNHSIVLCNHDAIIKWNCSLGISIEQLFVNLYNQLRATHCIQASAWHSSPPTDLLGRFGSPLLSDYTRISTEPCFILLSHPTFWGTTQKAIWEVNRLISLSNNHFYHHHHGLSAGFQPGKLPFLWWSFPWGNVFVDLTLFSYPSFFTVTVISLYCTGQL